MTDTGHKHFIMGRYSGKSCRLICMLSITFVYFLVEIVIGFTTHSLALIGDSYHMLSDVVALSIGLASVRVSRLNSNNKNTYGWARAEVLGALTNAVFLLALCFTIFVEALERLINPEEIMEPILLIIVGSIGLLVNVIGLVLFSGHAHGHSHGGHSHRDPHKEGELKNGEVPGDTSIKLTEDVEEVVDDSVEVVSTKHTSSEQLNMKGVFLHVMGDALGSIVVIVSALIIKFVDDSQKWKYRVDPAMSLVMITIICCTTVPLLKESAMILLQTVPTHIKPNALEKKLVDTVEGISGVHEFHIWRLAGNRVIATAHIYCHDLQEYMRVAQQVKTFFHNEGIHSTTIQPEFVDFNELEAGRICMLECGPDKDCHVDTCCRHQKTGDLTESKILVHKARRGTLERSNLEQRLRLTEDQNIHVSEAIPTVDSNVTD